jgi:hypothetical protein
MTSHRPKCLRDKTIADIDRAAAIDPEAVWHAADIKRQNPQRGLMSARRILGDLYATEVGRRFSVRAYSGVDGAAGIAANGG